MCQIQVEISTNHTRAVHLIEPQTHKDDVCGVFIEVSSTMVLNVPSAAFPMEGYY